MIMMTLNQRFRAKMSLKFIDSLIFNYFDHSFDLIKSKYLLRQQQYRQVPYWSLSPIYSVTESIVIIIIIILSVYSCNCDMIVDHRNMNNALNYHQNEQQISFPPPSPSSVNNNSQSNNSFHYLNKTLIKVFPTINAIIGSNVIIPCNLAHFNHNNHQQKQRNYLNNNNISVIRGESSSSMMMPTADSPQLLLFYHGNDISGEPIYTIDMRKYHHHHRQHSSSVNLNSNNSTTNTSFYRHFIAKTYQNRARIVFTKQQQDDFNELDDNHSINDNNNNNQNDDNLHGYNQANLLIRNVTLNDVGQWWCRVDFRWMRTLISNVELNVHVPTKMIEINSYKPMLMTTSNSVNMPFDDHHNLLNVPFNICDNHSTATTLKTTSENSVRFNEPFNYRLQPSSNHTNYHHQNNNNHQQQQQHYSINHESNHQHQNNQNNFIIHANQGDQNLLLECNAYGGIPPPEIIWLRYRGKFSLKNFQKSKNNSLILIDSEHLLRNNRTNIDDNHRKQSKQFVKLLNNDNDNDNNARIYAIVTESLNDSYNDYHQDESSKYSMNYEYEEWEIIDHKFIRTIKKVINSSTNSNDLKSFNDGGLPLNLNHSKLNIVNDSQRLSLNLSKTNTSINDNYNNQQRNQCCCCCWKHLYHQRLWLMMNNTMNFNDNSKYINNNNVVVRMDNGQDDYQSLSSLSSSTTPLSTPLSSKNASRFDDGTISSNTSSNSNASTPTTMTMVNSILQIPSHRSNQTKLKRNDYMSKYGCLINATASLSSSSSSSTSSMMSKSSLSSLSSSLLPSFLTTIQLILDLNPTHVIIQSPIGSYLSDDMKTEVVCRSYGARPYSLITWLLDGVNVTDRSDYDIEMNYTESVLRFKPTWLNDQKYLQCLSYNPSIITDQSQLIQLIAATTMNITSKQIGASNLNKQDNDDEDNEDSMIKWDSIKLDIKYTPKIKLIARIDDNSNGHNSNREFKINDSLIDEILINETLSHDFINRNNQIEQFNVREGSNVTMYCLYRSKPNATVIRWSHNHNEIWQENVGFVIGSTTGPVTDNQSQNSQKLNQLKLINTQSSMHNGNYRCIVFNSEGRGLSNEIQIFVHYAPRCSFSTMKTSTNAIVDDDHVKYRLNNGQALNLSCPIDVTSIIAGDGDEIQSIQSMKNDQNLLRKKFQFHWSFIDHDDHDHQSINDNDQIELHKQLIPLNQIELLSKSNGGKQILLENNAIFLNKFNSKIFNDNKQIYHIECWLQQLPPQSHQSDHAYQSSLLSMNHPSSINHRSSYLKSSCKYEIHSSSSSSTSATADHTKNSAQDNDPSLITKTTMTITNDSNYRSNYHHCQLQIIDLKSLRIKCHILVNSLIELIRTKFSLSSSMYSMMVNNDIESSNFKYRIELFEIFVNNDDGKRLIQSIEFDQTLTTTLDNNDFEQKFSNFKIENNHKYRLKLSIMINQSSFDGHNEGNSKVLNEESIEFNLSDNMTIIVIDNIGQNESKMARNSKSIYVYNDDNDVDDDDEGSSSLAVAPKSYAIDDRRMTSSDNNNGQHDHHKQQYSTTTTTTSSMNNNLLLLYRPLLLLLSLLLIGIILIIILVYSSLRFCLSIHGPTTSMVHNDDDHHQQQQSINKTNDLPLIIDQKQPNKPTNASIIESNSNDIIDENLQNKNNTHVTVVCMNTNNSLENNMEIDGNNNDNNDDQNNQITDHHHHHPHKIINSIDNRIHSLIRMENFVAPTSTMNINSNADNDDVGNNDIETSLIKNYHIKQQQQLPLSKSSRSSSSINDTNNDNKHMITMIETMMMMMMMNNNNGDNGNDGVVHTFNHHQSMLVEQPSLQPPPVNDHQHQSIVFDTNNQSKYFNSSNQNEICLEYYNFNDNVNDNDNIDIDNNDNDMTMATATATAIVNSNITELVNNNNNDCNGNSIIIIDNQSQNDQRYFFDNNSNHHIQQ